MLHRWSKQAITAFWNRAHTGPGRMDIARGMDAALQVDAPALAPLFAALWAEALTDEAVAPMFFKVTQDGKEVVIPVDRRFLFTVLKLVPEIVTHETQEASGEVGAAADDGTRPDDVQVRDVPDHVD